MRLEAKAIRLILYGLPKRRLEAANFPGVHAVSTWSGSEHQPSRYSRDLLVILSNALLDDSFVDAFRAKATPETKLLVLNHCLSSDSLLSRFIDLQIRSSQRFYVAELKCDTRLDEQWRTIQALLSRLTAASESADVSNRILDARLEENCLKLVSPDFRRLEIPISKVPAFSDIDTSKLGNFKIDEDGSYLYWSDLDIHLGWEQLEQIVNPDAMRKALQKNKDFNLRYGLAIRKVREAAAIPISAIRGLSEKQLRRIERGECRATSNALRKLAKANKLELNEYLEKVAHALN